MRKIFVFSFLLLVVACKPDPELLNSDGHNHTHLDLNIPPGLPPMPIPADNPMSVEGVALGRKLFYDNILSANNTMSCASCHQLSHYTIDSIGALSVGIDGIAGTRNSMPLFNIGYSKTFFWDGGAANLESQVIGPITNPVELHETMTNVISKLQSHPQYPSLFKKAFGTDVITSKLIMQAVAQFERTMISANSKFDQWKRNETTLTEQEMRGMNIYLDETKGDCGHCHGIGSTFTDFEFRNTGLDSIPVDKGRALITLLSTDEGKFKTPSLRNIAKTAPYMHDGRFNTLRECIEHYNTNFKYTKNLAPELKTQVKNRMSSTEIDDLVAFLKTLTDYDFINNPNLTKPTE
ncbi:MAG: c-type cytochrome [Chitinophagaceae bacterium]|nr:c-type cytochrome [Chitinophagaceae bacterium]